MKAAEIRDLRDDGVQERIEQAQDELFRLRFRSATQELENPSLLRQLRRDLARMKTVLRERQLAQGRK